MVGKERSCHFLQQRGATDKNTEGYYGGKINTGGVTFQDHGHGLMGGIWKGIRL